MVEQTDKIQRVFEKREAIRRSTHRIIELAADHESIYEKENVKLIKKEINSIISFLGELEPYAPIFERDRVSIIKRLGFQCVVLLDNKLATPMCLDAFFWAVNSVEIKPTRKSVKVVVGADFGRLKALISKEERNF